jgi:hypothetical protein
MVFCRARYKETTKHNRTYELEEAEKQSWCHLGTNTACVLRRLQ